MLVYDFKLKDKVEQYRLIDRAIRTAWSIENKCIWYWMDKEKVGQYDFSAYRKVLTSEFGFAKKLNSMARQSLAECFCIEQLVGLKFSKSAKVLEAGYVLNLT